MTIDIKISSKYSGHKGWTYEVKVNGVVVKSFSDLDRTVAEKAAADSLPELYLNVLNKIRG